MPGLSVLPPASMAERPDYYKTADGLEAINVIESLNMAAGFYLGSVFKYLFRVGAKDGGDPLNDMKKARQYLDFYIAYLEKHDKI